LPYYEGKNSLRIREYLNKIPSATVICDGTKIIALEKNMNKEQKEKIRDLAIKTIKLCHGFEDEMFIQDITEIYEGFIIGINNNWEEYLTRETNDALIADRTSCPTCGTQVFIERTRTTIYTDVMDDN